MFKRSLSLKPKLRNSSKGRCSVAVTVLLLAGLALSVVFGLSPLAGASAPAEFDWIRQFGAQEGNEAIGAGVDSWGA